MEIPEYFYFQSLFFLVQGDFESLIISETGEPATKHLPKFDDMTNIVYRSVTPALSCLKFNFKIIQYYVSTYFILKDYLQSK